MKSWEVDSITGQRARKQLKVFGETSTLENYTKPWWYASTDNDGHGTTSNCIGYNLGVSVAKEKKVQGGFVSMLTVVSKFYFSKILVQ